MGAVMIRLGSVSGFVCFVLAAAVASDEPTNPDEKPVLVTTEKLRGKWKGPKDVPVTLDFTKKTVIVTVVAREGETTKPASFEWDYAIDTKGHWVTLKPLDHGGGLGSAKLNTDGTLSVFIVPQPPAIPQALRDVKFTPVKPTDPKK